MISDGRLVLTAAGKYIDQDWYPDGDGFWGRYGEKILNGDNGTSKISQKWDVNLTALRAPIISGKKDSEVKTFEYCS